ncbi:hypothetical protein [Streptomyces pactum]|uniref:Uncharacterized protein n=1 Tax=Streptomyces pactum TaxID=68249 RepID=A0A1S6JGJ8_9ACTN|nr:hypothetical protein [Streptomyces pactum]AQS70883.1 hypothetical protein B1H29_31890 [Streptomyces pactum]
MFGLITRRRHERETTALRARLTQAIEQRDDARTERNAFRTAAQTSASQFAEADATNRRLSGRVEELSKRNAALAESDPDYLAELEKQLAAVREQMAAEKKRADHLQARLDDALCMPHGGHIEDSGPWQPGFQKPKPEALS